MIRFLGRLAAVFGVSALLLLAHSPASGATFKLTSPLGGEQWMVGSTHNITWDAEDVAGQVLIEVVWRKKDGTTMTFASADGIPAGNGEWAWPIPYEFPVTDTVFARISLHDPGQAAAGMQDTGGDFSVLENPAPRLMLRSPAGGESWALNVPHRISWESRNLTGTVRISLTENGRLVVPIATVSASSGHVSWTPPAGISLASNYKVRVRSTESAVSSTSGPIRVIGAPPATKEWTFLAYIGADNNLEECELDDFLKLAKTGSDTHVNIVAEIDRHAAYDTRFGNWTGARRYYVTEGMKPTPGNAVQSLGEINTADEERLADYLYWAMDHYPARRYMLILSDHGYGWEPDGHERDDVEPSGGLSGVRPDAVVRDDTNGFEWITTPGLQKALKAAPSPVAVVGFDACSMDMIEVAYQLKDTGAKVFLASQNEEDYCGYDYDRLFAALRERPAEITEREIGTLMVDGFMDENRSGCPKWPSTHAAIDLTAMDVLGGAIRDLVASIVADPDNRVVVRSAAASVISATESAVIREDHAMYMNGLAFGTNIYFPSGSVDSRYTPSALLFVRDTRWRSFLDAYVRNDWASTWIGRARKGLYEEEEDGHVDLLAFCRGLVPEVGDIRVTVSGTPAGWGYTNPQGRALLSQGDRMKVQALVQDGVENARFEGWKVKGLIVLDDPSSSETTLTAYGGGSVTAVFSSGE